MKYTKKIILGDRYYLLRTKVPIVKYNHDLSIYDWERGILLRKCSKADDKIGLPVAVIHINNIYWSGIIENETQG